MEMTAPQQSFTTKERKIITLAALGGMLEFYDFIIYGIYSVYFAPQFFHSQNEFVVIAQSYFVFLLGYLARPIGGIIFSHVGDVYGRKIGLIITIILMGLTSLCVGVLPTYAQIGNAAPLCLLLLRLIQGIALGGELPTTYVYIREMIPHKMGRAIGLMMLGVNSGLLLGMVINQIINLTLTPEHIVAYGWRIPFIIGSLLCFVSYQIRRTLYESNAFIHLRDKAKFPLLYLVRHFLKEAIAITAMIATMASSSVVTIAFMPTYLHDFVKMDNHFVSALMTGIMLVNLGAIYISSTWVRFDNVKKIYKSIIIVSLILVPFSYWLIYLHVPFWGVALLAMMQGAFAMLTPYCITLVFPTKIRLTGVAVCYNIGFSCFGGFGPLFITGMIGSHHGVFVSPILYMLLMLLITSFGFVFFNKYMQSPH